jgi:hypothetical protein
MSKSHGGSLYDNDRLTSQAPPSSNMIPNSEMSDMGQAQAPVQIADINIPGYFSGNLTKQECLNKTLIENLDFLQTNLHEVIEDYK